MPHIGQASQWTLTGYWRSTAVESPSLTGELSLSYTLDLQLTGDHFVGKPSAVGHPTMPTQPFILSASINEL